MVPVPLLHTLDLLGLGVNATALVGHDYQSANDTVGNFASCAATERKPAIVGPARSKRHLSAIDDAWENPFPKFVAVCIIKDQKECQDSCC